MTAWSEDGQTGYQIGAKFQDGIEIANFISNNATAKQENITNGAVAADMQVSTRYPLSKLAGLGKKFTWSATASMNEDDVDRCATGDAKTKFPNT